MLRALMDGRPLCVRIDCASARLTDPTSGQTQSQSDVTTSTFIDNLENALSFSPSFSAITNLTSYIESFFPMKRNRMLFLK